MLYIQLAFYFFLFSTPAFAEVTLAEDYEKKEVPPVNHQGDILKRQLENDLQKAEKDSFDEHVSVKIPYLIWEEAKVYREPAKLPATIKFGEIDTLQETLLLSNLDLEPKELELYKAALREVLINFKNFFPTTRRSTRSGKLSSFQWNKRQQDLFHCVNPELLLEVAGNLPYESFIYGNYLDKIKSEILFCNGFIIGKSENEEDMIVEEELKRIFNHTHFGFKNEKTREEYLTTGSFGFLSVSEIEEVYKATLKLLNLSKTKDTFVFFGNTPYWLGRAFEALLKAMSDHPRYVISFPFSGSPNRGRGSMPVDINDCTTPERLKYLMSFLEEKGLSPNNPYLEEGDIYFVDNIGSGAGPAFVIEELIRAFQEKEKKLPNISLITMGDLKSFIEENPIPTIKNHRVRSIYKGEGKVYLPSINNTHFTIDLIELKMDGAHGSLDNVAAYQRFYPAYNANRWNPQYSFLHTLRPSTYIKNFSFYFDWFIQKYIQENRK
ncbi:hypothetical protein [Candidatus Odyssella acanthamoebae]|uniref:Uncharacterized protein n=1 Tax=Candidatus Odyssella acanthamoebae TaxID=91604 RepID=A0A077AXC6_9PROT|nr:hypothetical protein [Candidatus Paracaedibacter acanthamoebae]AIK96634.1 hypothetical protein ID47_07740 [Candidatus Paracaedibacter acanthamoebae]